MSVGQLIKVNTGEVFALGLEPVSIGRHGSNDIILADQQVSRHHAEIAAPTGPISTAGGSKSRASSALAIRSAWDGPLFGWTCPPVSPGRTPWWSDCRSL